MHGFAVTLNWTKLHTKGTGGTGHARSKVEKLSRREHGALCKHQALTRLYQPGDRSIRAHSRQGDGKDGDGESRWPDGDGGPPVRRQHLRNLRCPTPPPPSRPPPLVQLNQSLLH